MSTIEVGRTTRANEQPDQGLFQCGSCKRNYNRLDHLARHVRSHTNFKPHRCSVCGKSFSRTDLLKRHVAAHDVRNAKVNNLIRGAGEDIPSRVSKACRACAANHVRCSEAKPCRRCAEKGLECVYARIDDSATPEPTDGSRANHLMLTPSSMPSSLDVHLAAEQVAETMSGMDTRSRVPGPPHASPPLPGLSPIQSSLPQVIHTEAAGASSPAPLAHQAAFDDDFLGAHPELPTGCCTPTFAQWNFLPGLWSAAGGDIGVSQPFPGIELDDLDLRFLDTYNASIPFELGGPVTLQHSQPTTSMGGPASSHPASGASEAFRNYHWRFRPNPKDHGAAEEHNLSLPSDGRDHPSPASNISSARRATSVRLASAARDNILTIVVKSCRPDNLVKAVASFPSVELLDTLIQFYLTSPHARADTFIHAASFDPNEKKPELLLAMAAAGAVLTADPTLTKLGYAMQECVRRAIPTLWESDNTLVRNLELTQAFLINLETGLWSGLSRKVEITESFLQSPMTMMRRGGKFRKSSYPATILDANDQDTSDETAWRTWIQQESFKRTAFRLVQHDLNSSMYLMVNPLVSYAELSLPLPCAPALWTATSAGQWKSHLVQHTSLAHQPPSVSDYLDDPTFFKPHTATLDRAIANEAFLACAWSLAWECIQLTSLQRSPTGAKPSSSTPPRRWNPFLLTSRREELLKFLKHLRLSLAADDTTINTTTTPSTSPNIPNAPDSEAHSTTVTRMRLELILLHLHTPFEEVQTLAGIEGPDQARAAYPAVLDWATRTEQARRAICHAGQVLRFARAVGRGMLLGPGAVGMYQASLVLWVYALLAGHHKKGGEDVRVGDGGDRLWLDGEDEIGRRRFTHFEFGVPFLKGGGGGGRAGEEGGGEEVSLGDPEGVLGVVIGIVRGNYEGLPKPHLVERLLQLMEALQRSSAGMMDFHGQLGRQ